MAQQFQMTMQMRRFFLDRKEVRRRIGWANQRAMSKAGAFIRRRARSKLRRRKRSSRPGQPPSVHSTDRVANLKNIAFAYDPNREVLVVGPVKLNRKSPSWIDLGSATVPQILEFGDAVQVLEVSRDRGKTWWSRSRRRRAGMGEQKRQRRVVYQRRPFMGPALKDETAAGTLPHAWAGMVKG